MLEKIWILDVTSISLVNIMCNSYWEHFKVLGKLIMIVAESSGRPTEIVNVILLNLLKECLWALIHEIIE